MNDEKKYNEALERARKLYEQGTITESLCYVFPELKESKECEDERIRKGIIKYLEQSQFGEEHYCVDDDIVRDYIAWLEKQSEKPTLPKWKYKKDNTPLLRDSLILNKYGCVAKSPSGALVSDVWVIDYDELAKLPKEEIEKQGEKRPADKTEPKFKVGDWVVRGKTIAQILDIQEQYYVGLNINGNDFTSSRFLSDDKIHLWTIQDAKAGDILFCKGTIKHSNGIKYERICLFNNLDNAFFTLTKTSNYVEEYDIDVNIDYPDNTVPATKEQKEILFMAMKASGYDWDAEKKVLKKIEPKFEIGDLITNGILVGKIDEIHEWGYHAYFGDHYADVPDIENWHKWTIEDTKNGDVLSYRDGQWIFIYKEKIDDSSFYYHTLYSTIHQDLTINDSAFTLLDDAIIPATKKQRYLLFQKMKEAGYEFDFGKKELKEIVQSSTEWSEKDKNMLQSILDEYKSMPTEKRNWLKSLKDRVQPQNLTVTDEELSQAKKDAYNDVLDKLEYDNENPTFDDGWSAAIWYLKKRNAQPQNRWKPSDEQMEALNEVINYVAGHQSIHLNDYLYNILKQLNSQLKKIEGK